MAFYKAYKAFDRSREIWQEPAGCRHRKPLADLPMQMLSLCCSASPT